MEVGSADIPKLFKINRSCNIRCADPTRNKECSLKNIRIRKLASLWQNFLPTLLFVRLPWEIHGKRGCSRHEWRRSYPISNLSLAQSVPEGIETSGNAGPMNYKAAMDFLSYWCQDCPVLHYCTKHGYGIIHELESGTSFLMQERG